MSRFRNLIFLSVILIMIICMTLPVYASETGESNGMTEFVSRDLITVRVGYESIPGYEEGDDESYKSGWGYEYLQKVSYIAGFKYEYVYGNHDELYDMLAKGEIDLLGDVTFDSSRDPRINYSIYQMHKTEYYLFSLINDDSVVPGELSAIDGKTVAVVKDSYAENLVKDCFRRENIKCKFVYAEDAGGAIGLVKGEKASFCVATAEAAPSGFQATLSIGYQPSFFGIALDRTDIANRLNTAMRGIQIVDPYYNELVYSKYFSSEGGMKDIISTDEKNWLENHNNTLRVGYLKANQPYISADQDGSVVGVFADALSVFSYEYGIEIEYTEFSDTLEMCKALNKGELDTVCPMHSDPWLAEYFDLGVSHPLIDTTINVLYKDKDFDLSDNNNTVAVCTHSAIQEGVVEIKYRDYVLTYCENTEECLEAVADGSADFTLISSRMLNLAKQYDATDELEIIPDVDAIGVCFYTSKSDIVALAIVDRLVDLTSNNIDGLSLAENTYVVDDMTFLDIVKKYWWGIVIILSTLAFVIIIAVIMTRSRHKFKTLSETDGLTGLRNRASGEALIGKRLEEDFTGMFALMDANKFKHYNDIYGHDAGDDVLVAMSDCLKRAFRGNDRDIVMRLGGDEFALYLSGVNDEVVARKALDRFVDDLASVRLKSVNEEVITVSIGATFFVKGLGQTFDNLYKRADEGMYESKKSEGFTITFK